MENILMILIPLLIAVESGGNDAALGDYCKKTGEYKAVGCLQIHKIVVDDVNRIQKKEVFTYNDRYDRRKSSRIAEIYLSHYGARYKRIAGQEANAEVLSRIWNGGPNGYKKESTVKYWKKVEKLLK